MRSAAMQSLTVDLQAEFPGIVIFGVGDEPHKLRISDHNEDDTPGSRAAQSDLDDTPEHRAIDSMHGPAFNKQQAIATINEVLADPRNRERLRYINHLNTQWHMDNNFEPEDNSDDPHPTHVHWSGRASKDEDGSPWLRGASAMRTAALYRNNITGACLLREGAHNYGIPTVAELAAIQRLIKAAGGNANLIGTAPDDWEILLKTGHTVITVTVE